MELSQLQNLTMESDMVAVGMVLGVEVHVETKALKPEVQTSLQ